MKNPFARSGLGAALGKVFEEGSERRDQLSADRAARIMASTTWAMDFYPIIVKLHDEYLEKVKQGSMHIDTLKVLDDLVAAIDGSVQLGAGAMKRIGERRLKAAEIQKRAKEASEVASST